MTIERAIEILDPDHRERYESIEPVEEACRMGIEALKAQQNRELMHGRWIGNEPGQADCSMCGRGAIRLDERVEPLITDFCPWCGADMRLPPTPIPIIKGKGKAQGDGAKHPAPSEKGQARK